MMTNALIGARPAPGLHVMSFNVRRAMEGPLRRRRDRWSVRTPAVRELLRSEQPIVLGMQEVLPHAMRDVRDALGPNFRVVGRGRARSGAGEGNPLLYDADRLELHAWGQRALSDRPDEPGSRTWGNLIPRVFVWAELSERSSGDRFLAVNTHLDHLSPSARRRSAEALLSFVEHRALPSVVMGDLNAADGSSAVRMLLDHGILADTWDHAERRLTPPWGTFPGYRRPRVGGRRIDRIFVTPDMRVPETAINPLVVDGIRPSDHLAVQSLLRIEKRRS